MRGGTFETYPLSPWFECEERSRQTEQMDESRNGVVGYSMFDESALLEDDLSVGLSDTAFGSSNEEVSTQIQRTYLWNDKGG